MKYNVIYADPPWAYRNVRTGGSHQSGSAQKYPVLTVPEIASLPVETITAKDAVCALWATTPLGVDPFAVLEAWGFTYKTKIYWHKVGRKGTGYWIRGEVEELLIGVKGHVKAWRANFDNWLDDWIIEATPEGHSRKPPAVRDLLTFVSPGMARVELFATETCSGWDSYGLSLGQDFREPTFWTALAAAKGPLDDGRQGAGAPVQASGTETPTLGDA